MVQGWRGRERDWREKGDMGLNRHESYGFENKSRPWEYLSLFLPKSLVIGGGHIDLSNIPSMSWPGDGVRGHQRKEEWISEDKEENGLIDWLWHGDIYIYTFFLRKDTKRLR